MFSTVEIKNIFDDWVLQVQEEINNLRTENNGIRKEELAKKIKISVESLEYFIKDDITNENLTNSDFEVIKIEKIHNICPMCEDYAKEQTEKPVVIMSCEGACLRGEISRRAANHICHDLIPDKTVRLCLGGAFTKDGGQRNLVKNAQRVIALEGCFIKCASRMIKGVVPDAEPEVIITDKLFTFDTNIFGINEMTKEEIHDNSFEVAQKIVDQL
ncbi:MAG: putative zinc-binding protein [Firmicutes bacterium]|nr:putative zinc-binding protein [Bacillota bacterium]